MEAIKLISSITICTIIGAISSGIVGFVLGKHIGNTSPNISLGLFAWTLTTLILITMGGAMGFGYGLSFL